MMLNFILSYSVIKQYLNAGKSPKNVYMYCEKNGTCTHAKHKTNLNAGALLCLFISPNRYL